MNIFQAIFLGVLQGITEFIPVSSSGHLVLTQKIFGISSPTLFFETILHLGTLLAVCITLRTDIWKLINRPFQRINALLVMATAVTVIMALLFKNQIEIAFESGLWLGQSFLLTSAALFIAEYLSRRPGSFRNDAEMDWLDATIIGLLQGIALVPGVSRSGLTLSGALARKLDRNLAVRFAFLLSIPAILGAFVLQLWELYKAYHFQSVNPGTAEGFFLAGTSPIALIAGTLSAAIVGFGAITFMLALVRKRSLVGFGIYTAILGILILLDQNIFNILF